MQLNSQGTCWIIFQTMNYSVLRPTARRIAFLSSSWWANQNISKCAYGGAYSRLISGTIALAFTQIALSPLPLPPVLRRAFSFPNLTTGVRDVFANFGFEVPMVQSLTTHTSAPLPRNQVSRCNQHSLHNYSQGVFQCNPPGNLSNPFACRGNRFARQIQGIVDGCSDTKIVNWRIKPPSQNVFSELFLN